MGCRLAFPKKRMRKVRHCRKKDAKLARKGPRWEKDRSKVFLKKKARPNHCGAGKVEFLRILFEAMRNSSFMTV